MEERTMDVIEKFGNRVSSQALKDPEKARRLLLAGYRLQEKKLQFLPDRGLPSSGQYVARVVMKNIIQSLSEPENAAMVSIFVPGELVMAAGLTPYSVEAMSCFMAGTKCEQTFLRKTEEEGFPETMCSYHRVFLGAALTGILPKPNCMIYTNLACDGNMMTFPYLKDKFECPGFYIDVPYEKNRESVLYVADQLRKLKRFLEETTDRRISEETVRSAVDNSRKAAANYKKQLALRCAHDPVTSLTNELYALFMCHLMAGSETAVTYTEKLLRDSKKMHIRACDFIADGFQEMHAEDPYEAMAEKMVYCIYNGSVKQRIEEAERLARITESDGAVLFAHWGCKGTIGASSLIKQSLEKTGLPTMILDGDGCNPANTSDGQVSTRLQAFVEMLEKGKEEKHA